MTDTRKLARLPLCSAMALAWLANRKTQTRRVIVPQPTPSESGRTWHWRLPDRRRIRCGPRSACACSLEALAETIKDFCPYGAPGDTLVLTGEWAVDRRKDDRSPCEIGLGAKRWTIYDGGPKPDWCGRTRSARFVPRGLYDWFPQVPLLNVRVQRVQEICMEDALAEGFCQDVCVEVFETAAGRHQEREHCWLEDDERETVSFNGDQREFCRPCAEKLAREHMECEIRCDPFREESDGPAYCDECYEAIGVSLTEYGIDRELRLENDPKGSEPEQFPVFGSDARIAQGIAGNGGDLTAPQLGRLAQIGFATQWNMLNEKRGYGWSVNPWVWVLTFPQHKET